MVKKVNKIHRIPVPGKKACQCREFSKMRKIPFPGSEIPRKLKKYGFRESFSGKNQLPFLGFLGREFPGAISTQPHEGWARLLLKRCFWVNFFLTNLIFLFPVLNAHSGPLWKSLPPFLAFRTGYGPKWRPGSGFLDSMPYFLLFL